jgi:hypothetical protein
MQDIVVKFGLIKKKKIWVNGLVFVWKYDQVVF